MHNKRRELGKAIEALRGQLHNAVSDKRSNIGNKRVLEISSALDKLIVEWVKN